MLQQFTKKRNPEIDLIDKTCLDIDYGYIKPYGVSVINKDPIREHANLFKKRLRQAYLIYKSQSVSIENDNKSTTTTNTTATINNSKVDCSLNPKTIGENNAIHINTDSENKFKEIYPIGKITIAIEKTNHHIQDQRSTSNSVSRMYMNIQNIINHPSNDKTHPTKTNNSNLNHNRYHNTAIDLDKYKPIGECTSSPTKYKRRRTSSISRIVNIDHDQVEISGSTEVTNI